MNKKFIQAVENFVKKSFALDATGHDFDHIDRVRKIALHIAVKEGADAFIVEIAALLHDSADWKFAGEESGKAQVMEFLRGQNCDEEFIQKIIEIITHVSFKGAGVPTPMRTLEGKVVQDADRLDALGAIGIARTFMYAGSKGKQMYDPTVQPTLHDTFAAYQHGSHGIGHFYEKLLLLKDRMNTETAKNIAQTRHEVMENFLKQFYAEWNQEDFL